MSFAKVSREKVFRFEVPISELLDIAVGRLRRQAQYARPLAKGRGRTAGVETMIEQATHCLTKLARPEVTLLPVPSQAEANGINLADTVVLDGPDLARDVAAGGSVTAYLLTLGFDQQTAFEWLDGDYSTHHVQSDLSNEVLFALGRHSFRFQRSQSPDGRLRRIPIQAQGICGEKRLWDPARVQALLGVFGSENPGVTVSDTGCFQPLNSLLGLTIHI